MEKKEIAKEYTNGELTVVWKPSKGKPWIKPEMATTEQLKSQIMKCPSGALSFYMNGES